MKKYFLLLVLCCFQQLFPQSEVVTSMALPVGNSLKFNRFLIHPAFSFVREQAPLLTFYNKRRWVSFENAPQTYLATYSGRFLQNEGIGLGLFQQNEGVLTTFGALANFAHNILIRAESNLTFGVNLGFYKSGLDGSKVVTNTPDPIVETIPSTSFFVLNPGINYGTTFLDFGVSVKNLLVYQARASRLVVDGPEKSVSVHLMHTGYVEGNGFFDKSKFSALLQSDFRKGDTEISGLAMFTIPNGIWTQLGYHTLYGISAGLGVNISQSLALEYHYERGLENFAPLGASHGIGFAYQFSNQKAAYDEDEQGSIFPAAADRDVVYAKPRVVTKPKEVVVLPSIKEPVQLDSAATVFKKDELVPAAAVLENIQPQKDSLVLPPTQLKDSPWAAVVTLRAVLAETKTRQDQLVSRLTAARAQRETTLAQMKKENDLSEEGRYFEPKPFKSSALENSELEALQTEIAALAKEQKDKIIALEQAYIEQRKKDTQLDAAVVQEIGQSIEILKGAQTATIQVTAEVNRALQQLKEATEMEKKRRIKRASFMNVDKRLAQDAASLQRIKATTVLSLVPFTPSDFDSGEEQPEIQIIKGTKEVPAGYYLVIAVHTDLAKRDEFLIKTVAAGQANVNFFYDANSSNYFIYYDSFDTIEAAKQALIRKGSLPYNGKMAIVKIE